MKTIRITLAAFVLLLMGSMANGLQAQYAYNDPYDPNSGYNNNNDPYYDQRGEINYQTFYDELSPYGQWVQTNDYGYVWVPEAGDDFRPYSSNGHWVYTEDYEWLWVSDYDWGWAPFHYGRWEEDPYYGWFWVPGYEWSPAWVAWRDGGDYYGWAPLRPGINISVNFNIGSYNPPVNYWCFVPRRYVYSPRVYDYYVDPRVNVNIISYTTVININFGGYNRYGFRSGPSRFEAERYCGRINPVRFRDSYSPGRSFYRNNEVSFYRPQVNRNSERNFAPRQFERYDRNNAVSFRERNRNNEGRRDGDNRFRRNDMDGRGNSNDPRPDNSGFRRNERQPGNGGQRIDNNGGQQRERVFQPERRPDVRPDNRPDIRPDNRPNTRGNDGGGFRRDEPARDRTYQPAQERPQPDRSFERRDNNPGRERIFQPAPERPQPDRSFERRDNNPGRERTYQPAQERPQPDRSFERTETRVDRSAGNGGNNGGGNGNNGGGNGNGRRRF